MPPTCLSTSGISHTHHYSPAAEHHHNLAGTHFLSHWGYEAELTSNDLLLCIRQGIWTKMNFAQITHHATTPPHHNRFTALFPGSPRWASARRELLDYMVQGKINRGRYTDHLAGRHSIRTNQCLPPPSPIFLQARCPSCCPTNSVKALKEKHWRKSPIMMKGKPANK